MASTKERKAISNVVQVMQNNIRTARKELARRQRLINRKDSFISKVEGIDEKIAVCDFELTKLGQSVSLQPSGKVQKGKGLKGHSHLKNGSEEKLTLFETIKRVLPVNKEMRVKEIAEKVLEFGYPTKIDNETWFSSTVSKVLREEKDFVKVRRGVYKLKGETPSKKKAKKSTKKAVPSKEPVEE